MLNNVALKLSMVYIDSQDRYTVYDNCDITVFADILNQIGILKQHGWEVILSSININTEEPQATKVEIKSISPSKNIWCKHTLLFVKQVI